MSSPRNVSLFYCVSSVMFLAQTKYLRGCYYRLNMSQGRAAIRRGMYSSCLLSLLTAVLRDVLDGPRLAAGGLTLLIPALSVASARSVWTAV